jgi:hypothetical protein
MGAKDPFESKRPTETLTAGSMPEVGELDALAGIVVEKRIAERLEEIQALRKKSLNAGWNHPLPAIT